jgi:hypothetical protein
MLQSKVGSFQPLCQLSHDLINQLSVIVGNCDLLSKEALEGSEYARRLFLIREVAKEMAKQLNQHECNVDARIRPAPAICDGSIAKTG